MLREDWTASELSRAGSAARAPHDAHNRVLKGTTSPSASAFSSAIAEHRQSRPGRTQVDTTGPISHKVGERAIAGVVGVLVGAHVKYARVVLEHMLGAVAVVHVKVYDEDMSVPL